MKCAETLVSYSSLDTCCYVTTVTLIITMVTVCVVITNIMRRYVSSKVITPVPVMVSIPVTPPLIVTVQAVTLFITYSRFRDFIPDTAARFHINISSSSVQYFSSTPPL